jgi:hypothetical protein
MHTISRFGSLLLKPNLQAFGMIAAAALPVLMGNLLGSCELPPECHGTQEEAGSHSKMSCSGVGFSLEIFLN